MPSETPLTDELYTIYEGACHHFGLTPSETHFDACVRELSEEWLSKRPTDSLQEFLKRRLGETLAADKAAAVEHNKEMEENR